MFKLTLQDIALGWFETESPNWLTEDQMKQSFPKRFNPWGDTRCQQQDAWNKLKFNIEKAYEEVQDYRPPTHSVHCYAHKVLCCAKAK